MPKMTIQIAKLEAPSVDAAGRKFGAKAWDTAGTKYTVPKALFGMLQNGGWYEVFVEDKSYQGNPYKEIQSANATAPLTQPAAPVGNSGGDARGEQIFASGAVFHSVDAGYLNLVELDESDIALFIRKMRAAFHAGMAGPVDEVPTQRANGPAPGGSSHATGPAPGMQHTKDMDDEIPFITATGII